jgi:hypothetical protein
MMRHPWIGLLLLPLCACASFEDKVQRSTQQDAAWRNVNGSPWSQNPEIQTTFTTADARIITLRRHPVLGNPVLCVEPAPDVADALSSTSALSADGGNTTVKGSLTISGSATDAVSELAGRSTALLGLRDGLFQACEAYANGIIGQNAYALILSHYGQLMTTLFLGQDLSTAAKSTTGGDSAAAKPAASPTATTTTKTENTAATETVAKTLVTKSGTAPTMRPIGITGWTGAQPLPLGNTIGSDSKLVRKVDTSAPAKTTAKNTQTQAAGSSSPAAGSTVALAITRMNEDYINIGPASALWVVCINEDDRTRLHTRLDQTAFASETNGANGESWMSRTCRKFADSYFSKAAGLTIGALVPVDPAAGLSRK